MLENRKIINDLRSAAFPFFICLIIQDWSSGRKTSTSLIRALYDDLTAALPGGIDAVMTPDASRCY